MGFLPFRDGDIHSMLRSHMEKITKEIRSLDNSYVLNTSPTELEQYFLAQAHIEPLVLNEDYCIEDQRSIHVDARLDPNRLIFPEESSYHVPGTQLIIAIPFEGDATLWRIRPSSWGPNHPEIDLRDNLVLYTLQFADNAADPQRLKGEIQNVVASLRNAVETHRRDIEQHNATAPDTIKSALETKRKQAQAATGAVSAIGIPIKRRDQPATYAAPITRRKLPIHRPQPSAGNFQPEPELPEEQYQHIIDVMRSMSLVIERNPASFATLDEESIRDNLLLQLNAHYDATGETFNRSGKTDILIRVKERIIFIAECKFWHGPRGCQEAIDQLLGYLTWRDCKTALVIFNRQTNPSTVAQRLHETMAGHAGHRKTVSRDPSGNGRYIFVKESDPGRDIIISTLLFDVPDQVGG